MNMCMQFVCLYCMLLWLMEKLHLMNVKGKGTVSDNMRNSCVLNVGPVR